MTSPHQPSNKGSVIWIAGLALVVVLGIVALVAARGSGDDASQQVQTQQTSDVEVGASTAAAGSSPSGTPAGTSADALPTFESSVDDPAGGATIPTVSGSTLDGEPLTIGPDGTAKVIAFLAHWCPHCQREVPVIVDHLRESPMPDDVELLTVSTDVRPDADNYPPEAWLEEEGWTAPVLADSEENVAATAFGLSSFPYFVAVDDEGSVVARAAGEITTDQFDDLVAASQGR